MFAAAGCALPQPAMGRAVSCSCSGLPARFRPREPRCVHRDRHGLTPNVRRSLVLPTRSTPLPAPTHLCQRASLLAAKPVVTTRRSPAPTWSCVPLAQVTSPSDGLPGPSSSLLGRATRLVVCPHLAGVKKRRHGVPMNPGSRARIDAATPHRERHRRQAPRAAVASSNESAPTGVVSRRPS